MVGTFARQDSFLQPGAATARHEALRFVVNRLVNPHDRKRPCVWWKPLYLRAYALHVSTTDMEIDATDGEPALQVLGAVMREEREDTRGIRAGQSERKSRGRGEERKE